MLADARNPAGVPVTRRTDQEADMTTMAKAISHTLLSISGRDVLKQGLVCCGAGLLVWLLALTYGLDLSSGLF
jgi:hypothetical protein